MRTTTKQHPSLLMAIIAAMALLLAAVPAANAAASSGSVNPVVINFDSVSVPAGQCVDATAYLQSFGVSYSGPGNPQICNDADNTGPAIPKSLPNFFASSAGSVQLTYSLHFSPAVSNLSFYEIGIASPSTLPAWTGTAYNAQGQQVGASVGTGIEVGAPPTLFTIGGSGITTLTIVEVSPCCSTTTTNQPPLDNLTFTPSASADLALTMTAAPNPVGVGSNLTYTITARNNGPSAATGVKVTDALDPRLMFVSATSSVGSCTNAPPVTCSIGNLAATAPGNSAVITLVVAPTKSGSIADTATVAGNEPDPNAANNTATTTVTVSGYPNAVTVLTPTAGAPSATWITVASPFAGDAKSGRCSRRRQASRNSGHPVAWAMTPRSCRMVAMIASTHGLGSLKCVDVSNATNSASTWSVV